VSSRRARESSSPVFVFFSGVNFSDLQSVRDSTNGLLEEEETSAEEEGTEAVDVGAFIQTSMSSDQKAEEL